MCISTGRAGAGAAGRLDWSGAVLQSERLADAAPTAECVDRAPAAIARVAGQGRRARTKEWSQTVDRDGPAALLEALSGRNLVLVGLPGAGKSSVGKRLAARLGIPFVDADCEIEKAAGMAIADIFATHGEPAFREGEARVIARLLAEGPRVIATGGGAFMAEETRRAIAERGVAIWLDARTDVLVARVARRDHRPLFQGVDPRTKIEELRAVRDPVFAEAPVKVTSSAGPHERVVTAIVEGVLAHLPASALTRTRASEAAGGR